MSASLRTQQTVLKRIQTEKILLAMNFSWEQIQEELGLTQRMLESDRARLNKEGRQKASADIVDAYDDIRLVYTQAMHELQEIQDDEETDNKSKVTIIEKKLKAAKELFTTGVEAGVFDDDEEPTLENPRRIRAAGESVAEHTVRQLRKPSG